MCTSKFLLPVGLLAACFAAFQLRSATNCLYLGGGTAYGETDNIYVCNVHACYKDPSPAVCEGLVSKIIAQCNNNADPQNKDLCKRLCASADPETELGNCANAANAVIGICDQDKSVKDCLARYFPSVNAPGSDDAGETQDRRHRMAVAAACTAKAPDGTYTTSVYCLDTCSACKTKASLATCGANPKICKADDSADGCTCTPPQQGPW